MLRDGWPGGSGVRLPGQPFGMRLTRLLATLVVLSGALVGAVGAGVAQEGNATATNGTAQEAAQALQEEPEYIGEVKPTLRIVSYEYEDGVMSVTLESDVPAFVALSALSTAQAGGEGVTDIPQTRTTVPEGRTTLSVEASDHRGYVSVTVASGEGAVMLQHRTGSALFYGTPSWNDLGLVAGFGAAVGSLVPAGLVWRRKRSEEDDVRRLR